MANGEQISRQINSDDEALVLFSALGFNMGHWPFIKKVGSAQNLLKTEFLLQMLASECAQSEVFAYQVANLRAGLDQFYESGGFLISPSTNADCKLFKVSSAPLIFFGRFNCQLLDNRPKVAIVGSRSADTEALAQTSTLASVLAAEGVTVVSGGALGVDTAAHLGAAEGGGFTVVISGLRCNFKQAELSADLKALAPEKLLVLHPYGPFFPQKNYMFVTRNQFVAALSHSLIVVQGLADSGTLHTAKYARSLNIPIFALPGALNNPLSYVPNHLLAQGQALALVDFEEFASTLTPRPKSSKKRCKPTSAKEELPFLLGLIRKHGDALTMGELIALSGKSFSECQIELLEHELAGKIFKRGAQFVLRG